MLSEKKYMILFDSFDKATQLAAMKNRFEYIHAKAQIYLMTGPDLYRKNDFYGMPLTNWSKDELEGIKIGCEQILLGKGLTEENPFTDLGVNIFYKFFQVFHFHNVGRQTKRVKVDRKNHFIDKIDLEHVVDGTCVTYFNRVVY